MEKQIREAVKVLKNNGVIAFPTDTVYGLGANILSEEAVKKIFEIKKRNKKKSLSICVSSIFMLKKFAIVDKKSEIIIKRLLPGPFTFILPKTDKVPDYICKNTIGIRIPENKKALDIVNNLKIPITCTSANVSGEKDISDYKNIGLDVDFIVKGKCKYKSPSMVLDLVSNRILR